jgi:hypothetical protein
MKSYLEREVADQLKCSRDALRRMRRERRGPPWVRIGRMIRYPVAWLETYLEQQRESGREQ